MGSSMKGSQKQSTSQTNAPPAWALPLLQKVAGDAMGLYSSGQGYNTYRGPTQANFSPQRLEGLNRAMMMTGSTGPKITNESIFQTDQVKQIQGMIQKQVADEAARKAAAAAAAAAKKVPVKRPVQRQPYRPDSGGGGSRDRSESSGYGGSAKGISGYGGGTGSSAYGGKGPTGGNKGGLY